MLIIDASFAVSACITPEGFGRLREQPVAPPLMWSEARSVLHELVWRGIVPAERGPEVRGRLERLPVERREHDRLGDEAWRLADEFGWAKTYDAEYVALASLLGCRLVTLDARLRRATDRLGFVVFPTEP